MERLNSLRRMVYDKIEHIRRSVCTDRHIIKGQTSINKNHEGKTQIMHITKIMAPNPKS